MATTAGNEYLWGLLLTEFNSGNVGVPYRAAINGTAVLVQTVDGPTHGLIFLHPVYNTMHMIKQNLKLRSNLYTCLDCELRQTYVSYLDVLGCKTPINPFSQCCQLFHIQQ